MQLASSFQNNSEKFIRNLKTFIMGRANLTTRESEKNVLFELRDQDQKAAAVHKNFKSK